MKTENKTFGELGENIALDFLKSKGMKLLEKNFRCKTGEIDLILRDKDVLVFVEVKLRKSLYSGHAVENVTYKKQKKIINTAKYYMMQKNLFNVYTRFDVIGIESNENEWKVDYYRNAFQEF